MGRLNEKTIKIVAVTGGRDVVPTEEELEAFFQWCDAEGVIELRHGDCSEVRKPDGSVITGVDRTVANAAWDHGLRAVVPYAALWSEHGRAAGPMRNKELLAGKAQEGPVDALVAWPGGRGTADCKRRAASLGIPVIEIEDLTKDEDQNMAKKKKKAPKKTSTAKKKTATKKEKPSTEVVAKPPKAEVVPLPNLTFMDEGREEELADDYEVMLEFEIESADDYAFASEQLKEDKAELKAWETKEKSVTQDLSSALKKIRDLFRPRKKWLQKKEALWKEKMVEYDRRIHEQQRLALIEASRASKEGDRAAHQEALQRAAQAEVPSIEGVSTRYSLSFVVTNIDEVPRQFLVVDEGAVMDVIKEHNGEVEIPGIEVVRKATIAARV